MRIPGGVLSALAKAGLALEKRALEGLALERRAQKGLALEKRALGNADVERAQESAGVVLAQEGAVAEQALESMSSPHKQPVPPKARVPLPLAGLGEPRAVEPSSSRAAVQSSPRVAE